jgi:hypothetical protein
MHVLIVALLLLLPSNGQQQQTPSKLKKEAAPQNPTQSITVFVNPEVTHPRPDEKKNDPSKQPHGWPPWWESFWPYWAEVLVTGLAGFFAVLTLMALKRQTKATEDAARAATKSANALTGAERPWLVVEKITMHHFGDWQKIHARCIVKNHGRTPGIIVSTRQRFHTADADNPLPHIPEYGIDRGTREALVTPHQHGLIPVAFESSQPRSAQIQSIMRGTTVLWVYGIINYRSVWGTEEYKTKFCYSYLIPEAPEEKPGFWPDGPPAYHEAT